jgi:hypothetical protein
VATLFSDLAAGFGKQRRYGLRQYGAKYPKPLGRRGAAATFF